MRYFIDEQLEGHASEIKAYVFNIKDFTREALFDEFINQHSKNCYLTYQDVQEWREILDSVSDIDLMTKCVEEKFYVFEDDKEHPRNKEVIENIIDRKPNYNKWTNEQYI